MDYELYIFGSKAVEYFCYRCRQLRLSPSGVPVRCGHCGNKDIKIRPVGTIDKAHEIRKLNGFTE